MPESVWTASPSEAAHAEVLARYQTAAGPAFFTGFPGGTAVTDGTLAGADTLWVISPPLGAGELASGKIYCTSKSTGPYSVTFFDVPSTPTSFSGASSFGTEASVVQFNAPSEAEYAAELSLSGGGSIQLSDGARMQSFSSSGEFRFGTLSGGPQFLHLATQEGPQAVWTVQIHALPVVLSAVDFSAPAVAPGKKLHLDYTTSGATSVYVVINGEDGQPVRNLADGVAVGIGKHTLTWNGRDGNGNLLPNGSYTADVTTSEGQSASATTELDGGPQTVISRRPPRLSRRHAARFVFRSSVPDSTFECTYPFGWIQCSSPTLLHLPAGKYKFTVRAVDSFGIKDATPAIWRFRIRP